MLVWYTDGNNLERSALLRWSWKEKISHLCVFGHANVWKSANGKCEFRFVSYTNHLPNKWTEHWKPRLYAHAPTTQQFWTFEHDSFWVMINKWEGVFVFELKSQIEQMNCGESTKGRKFTAGCRILVKRNKNKTHWEFHVATFKFHVASFMLLIISHRARMCVRSIGFAYCWIASAIHWSTLDLYGIHFACVCSVNPFRHIWKCCRIYCG